MCEVTLTVWCVVHMNYYYNYISQQKVFAPQFYLQNKYLDGTEERWYTLVTRRG